ncbi:MAG: hypothetical protein GX946_10130 [Oligosphaeraceae bacterium]|nr:hypothetical protein [Oligosphaeraceae bacterium]
MNPQIVQIVQIMTIALEKSAENCKLKSSRRFCACQMSIPTPSFAGKNYDSSLLGKSLFRISVSGLKKSVHVIILLA